MSVGRGPEETFSSTAVRAARYGQITDSFSGRPTAGATVSLNGKLTTDADGWYLSNGGCSGCGACNTTFIYVSANGYVSKSQLLGRGYSEVQRLDIPLDRATIRTDVPISERGRRGVPFACADASELNDSTVSYFASGIGVA